ncbi:MAG: phage tail tape measure protein, partial [Erysipelotrichia bacterium]|nr:phage tail tape measure protein [Erysipelotrichia bacterium]
MSFETYLRVGIDASGSTSGANVHKAATDKIIGASEQAEDAKKKLTNQLKAARVALIAFGTAATYAAVRTISDFQTSVSSLRAVTNATAADMVKLEAVTRNLGATTMFSASQAAEGAKFLGMAGFRTNEIISALPATLDLAAAASLEMGQAADITSNIMSGFGIEAARAGEIADVLAAIASNANTDVSQMGQAMKFVGPIAKSLGITMQDTAAAVGVLANAGIQGGLAGRQLRSAISSLLTPSKEAERTLKAMGLTIQDVNPQAHGLHNVLQTLSKAGLDATKAFTIFGNEGATAMLELSSQIPTLERMAQVTNNAEGEAKRMADTMRDNMAGDAAILKSALSELALVIGDMGLTKAVRDAIQAGSSFVTWLTESLKVAKDSDIAFTALKTSIELLAFAVGGLMLMSLASWLKMVSVAMTAAATATGAFSVAIMGIPFAWVAGALSALGFSIYKVVTNWEYVGEVAHDTIMAMTNLIKRFAVGVFVEFGAVANFMVNRLSWIAEFAKSASSQAFYSATGQTQKFFDEQERFAEYTKKAWADAWMTDADRKGAIDAILGVENKDQITKSGIDLFRFFRNGFLSGDFQSLAAPIVDSLKSVISLMGGAAVKTVPGAGTPTTPGAGGAPAVISEAAQLQDKSFFATKDALASTSEEFEKYNAKNKEFLATLGASLQQEQTRNNLIKQYGGDLEKVNLEMKILGELKKLDIYATQDQQNEVRKLITATHEQDKANQALLNNAKKAQESQKQWTQDMTYAFKDAIMNSKNLGDALSNLANKVQNMLVNKALDSLLGGMFSSLFKNANGNVFLGGRAMAFAAGGVVNGPTIFPMATGMGLMGEAGP